MIYRRFGYLQTRLLLEKQDELRRLEEKLDRMDKRATKSDPNKLCTRDLRGEEAIARKDLMRTIEEKLCSYSGIFPSLSDCNI